MVTNAEYLDKIQTPLPGANPKSITVFLKDNTVTIRASLTNGQKPASGVGRDYYYAFRIAQHVDAEQISAEYAEGVLTLFLPRRTEQSQPREIPVKLWR